ncbi:MAG TPA: PAS domain S-box protein [Allosphingosinicella sp.]
MPDPSDKEGIFAAAIAASLDAVILFDEDGRIVDFNPAAEHILGYERAEAIGRPIVDLIVPPHLRRGPGLPRLVAGGQSALLGARADTEVLMKDGTIFPGELAVTELEVPGRRLFSAVLRNLGARGTRQELEMMRQRLELAVEGAKIGIWTYDPRTGSVWYSDRSHEIYGLERQPVVEARTLRSRVHPDDWEKLAVPYYQGFPDKPVAIEYRVVRPNGDIRWVYALGEAARDEKGEIHTVNGIHFDITDRKLGEEELARSREALLQSEKLGALGSLLAGVSHELNNPLAAIVGQAEMLQEDSQGTVFEERARKISAAADRCSRIVRTFLAMARQREPKRELVEVNDMIGAALEITEYGLRTSGVGVRVTYGTGLPLIEGDRDQLHQVLVNLIVNAQQAMEKGEEFEKILTIRTSVDRAGRVLIDLSDTGPGVPEDLRRRIFEPFFTTKKQGIGTGTGIGLSFSQGIVDAHGGSLSIEPSRRGAQFRISLPPAAVGTSDEAGPERHEEWPAAPVMVTPKHALIVEDEPDVADTLRELVEREGYRVTVARNGAQAFTAIDQEDFDLLMSDVRMPLLNGRELYERLTEIRPELVKRMSFVTGDTIGDSMADFLRSTGRPILEKPFTKAGVRTMLAVLMAPEPVE